MFYERKYQLFLHKLLVSRYRCQSILLDHYEYKYMGLCWHIANHVSVLQNFG